MMVDIKAFVDHIISDGIITKEEHQQFEAFIRADGHLNKEEQEQADRIISLIMDGKVKLLDE